MQDPGGAEIFVLLLGEIVAYLTPNWDSVLYLAGKRTKRFLICQSNDDM